MASEFLEIGKQTILLKLWRFEVIAKEIEGIYISCTGFSSLKLKLPSVEKSESRMVWECRKDEKYPDCGMGQGIDLR